MKNKNKIMILSTFILGVMFLAFGLSYSAFTLNQDGKTSKLIAGDVYVQYKSTNQIVLEDVIPIDIYDYQTYKVNPIMQTQEINELTTCVNLFAELGTIAESYCKGTKTYNGYTLQEIIDLTVYFNEGIVGTSNFFNKQQKNNLNYNMTDDVKSKFMIERIGFDDFFARLLLDSNIVIYDNNSYVLNPIMKTQKVENNELSKCVGFYGVMDEFDFGSTPESFCKGEGTNYRGLTIQEDLEDWLSYVKRESIFEKGFLDNGGSYLLDEKVIIFKIENLPYFEFTISGKNTYTKKDVWYEVVLNYGKNHATRTERIRDDLLRFSLIEIKDDEELVIFNNKSYFDLNNKRIHVDTISKSTNEEIEKTYRLYMWIDGNIVVGNVDYDYTMEEWNNIFASIKVDVSGDFIEKSTDSSCFRGLIENDGITIIDYDESCGNNVRIPSEINGVKIKKIGKMAFGNKYLKSVVLPSTVEIIERSAFIKNKLTEVLIPDSVTYLDCEAFDSDVVIQKSDSLTCITSTTAESCFETEDVYLDGEDSIAIIDYDKSCGTDVVIPDYINGYPVKIIGNSETSGLPTNNSTNNYTFDNLVENYNQDSVVKPIFITVATGSFQEKELTSVVIPDTVVEIHSDAFSYNKLVNVKIPYNVSSIGDRAFSDNLIENLEFSDNPNLEYFDINMYAFANNKITNLVLPNSVTFLSSGVFTNNQLETVTIGNKINIIGFGTFTKDLDSNPNLESITIDKPCYEVRSIYSHTSGGLQHSYPWLSSETPYTASGVTMYGSNGEVCNSY